jgi:hypothetical protein
MADYPVQQWNVFDIKSVQPSLQSRSLTGRVLSASRDVQWYEIEVSQTLTADQYRRVKSFINQVGDHNTFEVGFKTPLLQGSNTSLDSGNMHHIPFEKGQSAISFVNITSGEIINAGTYVKFSNHSKVYELSGYGSSNEIIGAGGITVDATVFPSLILDVPQFIFDPTGRVYTEDDSEMKFTVKIKPNSFSVGSSEAGAVWEVSMTLEEVF